MPNRTMAAKAIKLRKQNRSRPRRLSLDIKGARANLIDMGNIIASTIGLRDGDFVDRPPAVINAPPDKPRIVLKDVWLDNMAQRIHIYFYSRQSKIIIQRVFKLRRTFCVSAAFSCIEDAYYALQHECVPWREEKPFPDQPA